MRIHLVCLSVLLASLTASSSGCLAVVAGAGAAGTVAYMRGDVESEEPYNIQQVYAATKKTAEQLDLHVIPGETDQDALSATVVARDAADKRITIKLKATTLDTTRMSIRVGTFGDEIKSRMLYSKIMENLKASQQEPAKATPSGAALQSAQTPPNPPASDEPAQTPPGPPAGQQSSQSSPSPSAS